MSPRPSQRPSGPAQPAADLEQAWHRAYTTVEEELAARLRVVSGAIPRELRGIWYRNGPARFARGQARYRHLFDGDGMVASFCFDDLGVFYRNRFVRTEEFAAEEAAHGVRFRSFGTNLPGGFWRNAFRTRFKNAANTSVAVHGGKVLALWEGGAPHRIDPRTLETMGLEDFGGALRARGKLSARLFGRHLPFSAHPRLDASTGELFNFGLRIGPTPHLVLHRVDARGTLRACAKVPIDGSWFVHDFALTPRWLVFLLSPVGFGVLSMLAGRSSPVESLRADPRRGLRAMLVSRGVLEGDREPPVIIESDALTGFSFHTANAYERSDGVAIDAVLWDGFPRFPCPGIRAPSSPMAGRLQRLVASPSSGQLVLDGPPCQGFELPEIAPTVAGRPHRYVWGLAGRPDDPSLLTAIAKLDRNTGERRAACFLPRVVSGPTFVSRPGATREDEGWLLVTTTGAGTSDLVVLDAATLAEVATLRLPHAIPPGFHGVFSPVSPR